jgi:hypothetical protein
MIAGMDNLIRSFGMSGYLLTTEIQNIERQYSIELGHVREGPLDREPNYYPQFEQHVRAEASEMAAHYETFYCLEKAIRKLIAETLEEAAGEDWWNAGRVNTAITTEVATRIQKEVDSGVSRRSLDELDYTTFGELAVIITANWDVFGSMLNSRKAVEKVMSNLNTLRGPIAHCAKLSEDEVLRLRLTVRDWFRMME